MSVAQPGDYWQMPLELLTVKDLTDALGVRRSAELLNTSQRAIYTIRNKNMLSERRVLILIREFQTNEADYRQRLIIKRNMQKIRADRRILHEGA